MLDVDDLLHGVICYICYHDSCVNPSRVSCVVSLYICAYDPTTLYLNVSYLDILALLMLCGETIHDGRIVGDTLSVYTL